MEIKTLLILVILGACVSAGSISDLVSKGKQLVTTNHCFDGKLQGLISELRGDALAMFSIPKSEGESDVSPASAYLILKEKIQSKVATLRAAFQECNLNPTIGNSDWILLLGNAFILGSDCFKDVGTFLLILDTIVQDPTNITNMFFGVIFIHFVFKSGVANCNAFFEYIREIFNPHV